LDDPMIAIPNEPEWIVCKKSELEEEMEKLGISMPEEIKPPEPYRG